MDDPEVADNPLLRALRMAGEKNREEGNERSSNQQTENPLEAILKNRRE